MLQGVCQEKNLHKRLDKGLTTGHPRGARVSDQPGAVNTYFPLWCIFLMSVLSTHRLGIKQQKEIDRSLHPCKNTDKSGHGFGEPRLSDELVKLSDTE